MTAAPLAHPRNAIILFAFHTKERAMTSKGLEFLAGVDGVGQAELLARGELSAAELLEACAARVERCEPLIHATVTLDFQRARAQPPAEGPFKGVPTLLKDVFPYPGLRWGMGS